jgi:hypothetical protein
VEMGWFVRVFTGVSRERKEKGEPCGKSSMIRVKGRSNIKKVEQVCTDICQQTTANPAVFLHLSISLFPEQWVSTTSSIQKKGGRKGNKKRKRKASNNPRQEIQFLKPP